MVLGCIYLSHILNVGRRLTLGSVHKSKDLTQIQHV